jgi:hypothetical protein
VLQVSQPALDKMIAIADAFDRDAFAGVDKVDTDSVAAVVEMPSSIVSRLMHRLGFDQVSPRRNVPVRNDRVYEYPARIKLPDLKGIRNPDTRLIVEAIADHRLPRQFSIALLYSRLGDALSDYTIRETGRLPEGLRKSLANLGFTSHRPPGFKKKNVIYPATWRRPMHWPSLFVEQRRLRRNGLGVSAVLRMTDAAARLGAMINIALEQLDYQGVPYDRKGALKAAIRAIITDAFDEWLPKQHSRQGQVPAKIDWTAVSNLSDGHLRNFASIAARMDATGADDNPGAYALRWVLENLPGAGTDAALRFSAKIG